MKNLFIILSLTLINYFNVLGQRNIKDSTIGTPWIAVHYGANWTKKDLSLKFGFLNHIGSQT